MHLLQRYLQDLPEVRPDQAPQARHRARGGRGDPSGSLRKTGQAAPRARAPRERAGDAHHHHRELDLQPPAPAQAPPAARRRGRAGRDARQPAGCRAAPASRRAEAVRAAHPRQDAGRGGDADPMDRPRGADPGGGRRDPEPTAQDRGDPAPPGPRQVPVPGGAPLPRDNGLRGRRPAARRSGPCGYAAWTARRPGNRRKPRAPRAPRRRAGRGARSRHRGVSRTARA